jgi:bacterioferritin-associated ferredoxin
MAGAGTVSSVWVCLCEAVTSGSILEAVDAGARTVREIGEVNGAGTSCGKCVRNIHLLIQQGMDGPTPEKGGRRWSRTRRS